MNIPEISPREAAILSKLTSAQISRRKMMIGALASGALFASLGSTRMSAFAQATPTAALSAGNPEPYTGALSATQEITLPMSNIENTDPGVSYGGSELNLFYNIFDGLVRIDQQTGEIVPAVAESWEINADASEYTFHIRQGVTWSDGTPLNANDFVYSISRVLDPELASQYTPAVTAYIKNGAEIEAGTVDIAELGVKATDDYTLVITLVGPTVFFPLVAATWTYFPVPKHVVDAKGADWFEPANIVSNGPYLLTAWDLDQQFVLEPNASYYGEKPTITKATWRIYDDATSQSYASYENNELDYSEPGGPDLERILADPAKSAEMRTFPLSNNYFMVCDTTNAPTDVVEFRQALYKSIDRETLAQTVFKNEYDAAYTVLSPDIPGNNPAAALTVGVDEAKALLTTAGIDPGSIDLELTFRNTAPYSTVAQFMQSQWQDGLGIKVTLVPIEPDTYSDWRASRATAKFGVYTGNWGSDFGDASNWFNQNFTTEADHYESHWSNADFDALCAEAVINTDIDARNQQYSDAEVILVDQASIIPHMRGKAFRAVKPWVKDLYFQSLLSLVHLRTIKIAEH
ncbi:MAG: peptide ABC transporter substrate-binding protein [Thermomicrobiales bacterium]